MLGIGGSNNRAAREATRAEGQRSSEIAMRSADVNRVFDDPRRGRQINDYVGRLKSVFDQEAGDEQARQARRMKFSMARAGQTGGSLALDANRLQGQNFLRALLESNRRATSAGDQLRAQDEGTRSNLLQSILGGASVGTSAIRSAQQVGAGMGAQQQGLEAKGLGDLFATSADIYKRQEENELRRRAQGDFRSRYYGET